MIDLLFNTVDKIFNQFITFLRKVIKDKKDSEKHDTEIEIINSMIPYNSEVLYEIRSVTKEPVHIKRLHVKDINGNSKNLELKISLLPGESYFTKESSYGLSLVSVIYTLGGNKFERTESEFKNTTESILKFNTKTRAYIDEKIGMSYDNVQRLSNLNELKKGV